jgi:hypothetical protein
MYDIIKRGIGKIGAVRKNIKTYFAIMPEDMDSELESVLRELDFSEIEIKKALESRTSKKRLN